MRSRRGLIHIFPDIHSILISSFTLVMVATQVSNLSDEMMNMFKALAGLICLLYFFLFGNCKYFKKKVLISGALMSILMILSILYNGNAKYVNLLWIWSFIGAGAVLYEGGISDKMAKFTFYSTILFFCYQAFIKGSFVRDIVTHGSENNVSFLCIFATFLFYLPYRDLTRTLPYIPIFLVMFLSIWAGNRSAILGCGLFFLLLLLINYKIEKFHKNLFLFYVPLIVVCVAAIWIIYKYMPLFDSVLENKMERQGLESARTTIWSEYFIGIFSNIGDLLFGPDTHSSQYPSMAHYDGNPHNSFLMLHAKYGLIGFLFVIKSLKKAFINTIKLKEKVLKAIFILIVLRSFFDWMAFPGSYDVFFWFFIFYSDPKLQPLLFYKRK